MSSESKNLEAIYKAIDIHNASCEFKPLAILMNPFEVERLGWDEIRGIPIESDSELGTGVFRILCEGENSDSGVRVEDEELVYA